MQAKLLVHQWDAPAIDQECGAAHAAYAAARTAQYTAYFAARPDLRDPDHAFKAKNLASALPEDAPAELAQWLPAGKRHLHHLSGNSSQTLALGILGAAAVRDRSLEWWWEALGLNGPSTIPGPATFHIEADLHKTVLGETGRVTAIDFLATDADTVIACECKWVEDGIGRCNCPPNPTVARATGACRAAIHDTAAYWETAQDIFKLSKHELGANPCRLGFAYQAVRNVAAALALANETKTAVFVLVYDEANPYFAGYGDWPGWPTVLEHTLDGAHPLLEFRALTWQQLLPQLPLSDEALTWASDKHGLGVPPLAPA